MCAYRGDGGTKCAAGCLIGDDEYDSSWENRVWGVLPIGKKHNRLITILQDIHDGFPVHFWEQELRKLAAERGLSYNV